jgi:hypothetical protein
MFSILFDFFGFSLVQFKIGSNFWHVHSYKDVVTW